MLFNLLYKFVNIRNYALHKLYAPFFQSLCHYRMVCIVKCLLCYLKCFVKRNSVRRKQSDKLRNSNNRMCVVKLNCTMLCKLAVVAAVVLFVSFYYVLQRRTAKEILLF